LPQNNLPANERTLTVKIRVSSAILWTLVVLLGFLVATPSWAADKKKDKEKAAAQPAEAAAPAATAAPVAPGQYKIGVVDLQKILQDCEKRKSKYADLEKEKIRMQTPIDELSKKIEGMKKKYEESKGTMSDEERLKLENQVKEDYATYKSEFDKAQQKIDNLEKEVMVEVMKDVNAAIDAVGQEDGYHLLLNAAGGSVPTVLYHSATIDITSKVLARLNGKK
jgi:outer membrane protein